MALGNHRLYPDSSSKSLRICFLFHSLIMVPADGRIPHHGPYLGTRCLRAQRDIDRRVRLRETVHIVVSVIRACCIRRLRTTFATDAVAFCAARIADVATANATVVHGSLVGIASSRVLNDSDNPAANESTPYVTKENCTVISDADIDTRFANAGNTDVSSAINADTSSNDATVLTVSFRRKDSQCHAQLSGIVGTF